MPTAIVWFRQDLRLADNTALFQACHSCEQVIPVFIDDPTPTTTSQLGAASRVWLHHSLRSLSETLAQHGSRLILRQGSAQTVLEQLIAETGASHLYWNRCYAPAAIQRDQQLKATLKQIVEVHSFRGNVLYEPWEILKPNREPYKVYTPFWKALNNQGLIRNVLPKPAQLPAPVVWPVSLELADLNLLPLLDWHWGMMGHWHVGEAAAQQALQDFLGGALDDYDHQRDYPFVDGTSQLSPHLHFGEISPTQISYATQQILDADPALAAGYERFMKELVWREFAIMLLYHFPHTLDKPLDSRFEQFPWAALDEASLRRWQQGQTGIPIVDAGMRQLWQSGWMHNRVRMIVASFLTKNLRLPWQLGEQWFRDTLVDADLANNVLGWQWVAGCGADAAPYFRIFNPILQGEKFDAQGLYVKRWVPELATRSSQVIHQPRQLGEGLADYPLAMLDLAESRQQALAAFASIKSA
ncbi:cryptochrome/photolyase family protein [Thiolinea disciformis]|uniref:cryptochrome/photolyase family protein n=1 Tax=Thiolinea disciformis TaxID=125614 RepID=UPI0003754D6F|nr:deoxyribodipyrimidine photo-lyase [Thiolinea disciformis]